MKTFLYTMATLTALSVNAQNYQVLDINKVKAGATSHGSLHYNPANNANSYEVPQGSGRHTSYLTNLWFGGLDGNNNLYFAGQTAPQSGLDFWPGPLSVVDASTTPSVSAQYDKVWKINKSDIDNFLANYTTPGYVIPPSILNWPGNGDISQNHDMLMAPFADTDNDGIYTPANGDYPLIKGDQALFFVYNDVTSGLHASGGKTQGLEIRCLAYAYGTCSVVANNPYLDYTTFYDYTIINRATTPLNQFQVSLFTEADLGQYGDDYIGCDIQDGYGYIYNGDATDENAIGSLGYGSHPPAAGIVMLRGPVNTADGIDNDQDGSIDEPFEEMPLTNFSYYKNSAGTSLPGTLAPVNAQEYYNYMRSLWKDGTPFTCDAADGYGGMSNTPFAFPGTTYTNSACTANWQETQTPGDRRYIMGSGPKTLYPGEVIRFEVAHVTSFDSITNNPLQKLDQDINALKTLYQNGLVANCLATSLKEQVLKNEFKLYPNPAGSTISIISENVISGAVTIEVLDVLGKTVSASHASDLKNYQVNTESLIPGVYFIKIVNSNNNRMLKFVKE